MELHSSPENIGGDIDCKVYVAVGKSTAKATSILDWTFRSFPGGEICILHVHQPSPLIPTLLGKLPASQANHEVVSAYRIEEKEKSNKLLLSYLSLCRRSKVKASILQIEAAQVQNGIIDLVNKHGIKKLVMGDVPDSWMKVKRNSNKANHAAKHAPRFCQIWFIYKGKHVWTRESSSEEEAFSSTSCSLQGHQDQSEVSKKTEEESLYSHLIEIRLEIESLRMEASRERSKSKHLESEAAKSINKVKDLESACEFEINLTLEAEDAVKDSIQKQEKLVEKREDIMKKLQKTIRNVAVLDSRVQEANRRSEEATSELKVLETSIASLQREKHRIQRQRAEATRWIGLWKNGGHDNGGGSNGLLAEFSVADLQTATCNFSESFIIGEGGNGCVYKGEMLDRTVAIKMWHPRNMQGQEEFQQQVQNLGKLRHSNLVTLVGICPEAWSVVHEYLPNGNLQNLLTRKNNKTKSSLTWKVRARLVAEISSTLMFLHSESIIHGNLKPENILLDTEFTCKLCDYGICTIMREDILRCPSFGRYNEPKAGAFSHTDPEFQRTGVLTPKSDVYSFGLIVLQLLTGRSPIGLINELRKAVSTRKLASLLDMSAGEWPTFVSRRLVDLGLQFCELNSRERPMITLDLVKELQNLHTLEDRSVPSFFLCPIHKEIMYDPQVAADGFTYEGEEILTWLENGNETSPMTNLKLDHLIVTPNHSVRLAIQYWLCKP
ncbi:U-box domain-containing protein 33-like [Impatiens glandulifera]|uniref:U-box domain-containing protein 33-like n=1 Tax=Impatiens glandulifera TaxID=253017 RepID=UPI001FB04FF2|nr:U-box domain-containing protein 33-like [Impatiens glandulifera]